MRIGNLYLACCAAVVTISTSACDPGELPPESEQALGTVTLALSGDGLDGADRVQVVFTDEDGVEQISDDFALNDAPVTSRNYRLQPGAYEIRAEATDAAGDVILAGETAADVQPGNNDITIALRPAAEDLGDLRIAFVAPEVDIAYVAATGDTVEGGQFAVTVTLDPPPAGEPVPTVRVGGAIEVVDSFFVQTPLLTFELNVDPSDPYRFTAQIPADWLGPADLKIEVFEDELPADSTAKQIIGHPSVLTEELSEALLQQLVLQGDGTLGPVVGVQTPGGAALTPEGITAVNGSIDAINDAVLAGNFVVAADMSNVVNPLMFASRGYAWCVLKIIACELMTAGCIAAAPAAAAACGGVCVGTAGLGCVSCIVAAVGAGVALCDQAMTCWGEAKRARCI